MIRTYRSPFSRIGDCICACVFQQVQTTHTSNASPCQQTQNMPAACVMKQDDARVNDTTYLHSSNPSHAEIDENALIQALPVSFVVLDR